MKNCPCDIKKVLKNVVQISCPIQHNGIDFGLFAVAICLHIFDGAEVGPHIFPQHEITQLRAQLPSLLSKDRDERCYGIWSQFQYLSASLPSSLPPQGVIPRSPMRGIELPQTIKLIAGGSVKGIISFKATWIYMKPLYGNLFDSSSSEFEDDPRMKPAMVTNLRTDDPVAAQYSVTNSDSDGSSDALEVTRTPSKTVNNKLTMEILLTGSDADSGTTIPAETVLKSNLQDEWRVENTGPIQKLEVQFNKKVSTTMINEVAKMMAFNEQSTLVDNIHVFNDNNKYIELDNDNEQQLQVIERVVNKQQTNTAMGSEVSSSHQSKTVNFEHSKEFQECMDTYEISKGVDSFEKIALAIAFYESSYYIHLNVMKSSANHYQQYSCKQHLGCTSHVSFGQH